MDAPWDDKERAAFVALLRMRPRRMTWSQIMTEVDLRGSALALWRTEYPADLLDSRPMQPALTDAAHSLAEWRSANLGFSTFLDHDYPTQLREIHDLPPVLFHRGHLAPGETAMSVVGSRAASSHGLTAAKAIAAGLVERGIAVVAGLARGIDTAAHVAARRAGGRTVAVIGTGINCHYPAENRALQEQISQEGLVLSQFWPDTPPIKHHFPMRNTVMSGYGRATIVVEAGEQSGARIQARRAVAHGRPVILTDHVVEVSGWPSEIVGRPGVHVAGSVEEVLSIADVIAAAPAEIDQLFTAATKE